MHEIDTRQQANVHKPLTLTVGVVGEAGSVLLAQRLDHMVFQTRLAAHLTQNAVRQPAARGRTRSMERENENQQRSPIVDAGPEHGGFQGQRLSQHR